MNNLTPRAQQALLVAGKIATKYSHSYVGTEHLMLALLEAQGAIPLALKQADVNVAALKDALVAHFTQTANEEPKAKSSFDPGVLLRDLADLVDKHRKTL